MYPHRIRLRGPWESQPLSAIRDPLSAEQAGEPAGSGQRMADSGQRFRRRFGYPGRIDAHERVWLTLAGIAGSAEVTLNEHRLGSHEGPAAFEFEATSLLRPRNELIVDVKGAAKQDSWRGDAALEIRCTAFLRAVRCTAVPHGDQVQLRITGAVVGESERPLELYVVVERSTAAYQVVTPAGGGQPFEIIVPDLPPELWRPTGDAADGPMVKVDLVNGAVVWYTSAAPVRLEKLSIPGG